jgi:hypothetical protein
MESIIFKDCIQRSLLKARNREEQVLLINKEGFFFKLQVLGIRKNNKDHPNLIEFLRLDIQFPHLILFKKLVKAVEIFSTS